MSKECDMKCDVCGDKVKIWDKYVELTIGYYVHAHREHLEERWKKLPEHIKQFYGSFEKYFDEMTCSLTDIRYFIICLNCLKDPVKLGQKLREKIVETIEGE